MNCIINQSAKEIWYAVMTDADDNDWGYGSHSYNTAVQMVKPYIPNGGYIAVIEDGKDPICVDEIRF